MPSSTGRSGAQSRSALVGVISDTHGVLPGEVRETFAGVDLIVHAGDVGAERVLHELNAIAPVIAVAGNTDHPYPTWRLQRQAEAEIAGMRVRVAHVRVPRGGSRADIVVTGHTHRPEVSERDGVVHVNPGSASSSRTHDGRGTVALLRIAEGAVDVRIVELPQVVG